MKIDTPVVTSAGLMRIKELINKFLGSSSNTNSMKIETRTVSGISQMRADVILKAKYNVLLYFFSFQFLLKLYQMMKLQV